MTKLLAFDTSMSSTGYALFVDCKISEYGSIDISPKLKGEDSVREMIKGIYEKIDEYDP